MCNAERDKENVGEADKDAKSDKHRHPVEGQRTSIDKRYHSIILLLCPSAPRRTIINNKKRGAVYHFFLLMVLRITLKQRCSNSPRYTREAVTLSCVSLTISQVLNRQDEDITLRDFLVKSGAKIHTFCDVAKLFFAVWLFCRIFAVGKTQQA